MTFERIKKNCRERESEKRITEEKAPKPIGFDSAAFLSFIALELGIEIPLVKWWVVFCQNFPQDSFKKAKTSPP